MNKHMISRKPENLDWSGIPAISMTQQDWTPAVDIIPTAQICYDDKALYVRLAAKEEFIRAEGTGPLDAPCEDSCLEFFFCPCEGDMRYFNIEFNPNCCVYLGFGTSVRDLIRFIPEETDIKVSDIAFEMGFGSVDGYQRAFLREFGCNPKEYAKSPVPIALFVPYGVKFRELRKDEITMENLKNVFIQQIHKPARKAIIKRGSKAVHYFEYCEEVGCDVWGKLLSMDSICGEPVCLWLTEKYRCPNTSEYVQGVEVPADYNGIIPEGFDIIELPECDYLMFQGEPFNEEDYCEAIIALQKSIEKYDPTIIGFEWDNEEPRIQLEPVGERGYIEFKAVKRK